MEFNSQKKDASEYTKRLNQNVANHLGIDLQDAKNEELEIAKSHLLKKIDDLVLKDENGETVWDITQFNFYKKAQVPDTVNPSLWVNGKCNFQAGVYSVVGRDIIQVRGIDAANITFVRSKTGWIVVDTMMSVETAKLSVKYVEEVLQESVHDRIRAIIVSHSHSDHYGGLKGLVTEEQVGKAEDGKIPIYVPAGFLEATVTEMIYAGTAMKRRCNYQVASNEEVSPKGLVTTGLGLSCPKGTISFIAPTDYVNHDQTIVIDGLAVEFQLTPGTEAPAEMNNYFPEYRALWMAENCSGSLHNLYPIRGAKVRDSCAWSRYTRDALVQYGDRTDVVFQAHNWPHWNTQENPTAVKEYLRNNAAIYKFIHDQTLLYANQGYTPREIVHKIKVPEGLHRKWYIRPYYGSVQVNVRAVYQNYLGYYDANPIHLVQLTEAEEAKKFVEYVGSESAVLEKAEADFKKGEYQFAAEAANKVVFVNPENQKARLLCADAMEQLGYQQESSILRNAYLTGAGELRRGKAALALRTNTNGLQSSEPDVLKNMTSEMLLDYLGIVLDTDKASEENIKFYLIVQEDEEEKVYLLHLYYGILLYYEDNKAHMERRNRSYIKLTKQGLLALTQKKDIREDAVFETNDAALVDRLEGYIVDLLATWNYPIIEP